MIRKPGQDEEKIDHGNHDSICPTGKVSGSGSGNRRNAGRDHGADQTR